MKIGDLVEYRGWSKDKAGPMAIVLDHNRSESNYHSRIRVLWLGEQVPIQASVVSTSGSRISSWVHPKYFEIINEDR